MTEQEQRLAEIEKRLREATPGQTMNAPITALEHLIRVVKELHAKAAAAFQQSMRAGHVAEGQRHLGESNAYANVLGLLGYGDDAV